MPNISDSVAEVKASLGNRVDLDATIKEWIWKAYRSIARSYPFEELETEIDDQFVVGQDLYAYPQAARAVKMITVYLSANEPKIMDKKSMKNIRRIQNTPGTPTMYAALGAKQIVVRSVPNKNYATKWLIWQEPEKADPVEDTPLLVPEDWITEVIEPLAVMYGFQRLQSYDKAQAIFTLLYGNPMRKNPGKIKQLLSQRMAEIDAEEFAIAPNKRRYTNSE